jgi:peptidoglycan/LPS O-acetylase OafA/YrhL
VFVERPPRLIPARPAVAAFAVCVVLAVLADLTLAAGTFRWVSTPAYLIAGGVLLLADLPPTRRPGWRLAQVIVGAGFVGTALAIALGGA